MNITIKKTIKKNVKIVVWKSLENWAYDIKIF